MCKKLCLAVGAVIVGLSVISFTGLSTLLQVKWNESRSWMERQVPPETQLKQLQVETEKIDQDIKKNLGKLAAQKVEAERLEANLNKMKDSQTALREDIAAMTKALDSKETKVSYNGRTYRQSELAMRLEAKVNDYEMRKTEIKTKEQLLAAKLQSLDLANQRMTEMREQKEKLRVTIAKLEARIENVKLQQVDCPFEVDNSQVNKCNVLADKLDRQLAEEEMKTKLYHEYGFDKKKEGSVREEKTIDEIKQAAKKALQNDDDEKVVDNK
jgi:multidrug efflux pump subunit AcrB